MFGLIFQVTFNVLNIVSKASIIEGLKRLNVLKNSVCIKVINLVPATVPFFHYNETYRIYISVTGFVPF